MLHQSFKETVRYLSRRNTPMPRGRFESLDERCMLSVNVELLADINPGAASALVNSRDWAELDGFLYFTADDGISGSELWRTDGTEAGTSLVADINDLIPQDPFALEDSLGSFPFGLTLFNDEIYFAAQNEDGDELWKTDGTDAGTTLVADINPGFADAFPFALTVFRDELYFGATTDELGDELWKTDGTEAGTVMVADIEPGAGSSFPTEMYVFNDELFFSASEFGDVELWKTDGTEAGTVRVSDIHPGETLPSFPEGFFEFQNELYFIAADDITPDGFLASHLYKTDGTEAGTVRVADERLTVNFTDESPNVVEFNDQLYFGGIDAFGQWELYRTTGTPGESELVVDLAGNISGTVSDMAVLDGELYFAANDESGRQLWRTNGELGAANVSERLTSVEFEIVSTIGGVMQTDNIGAFPTELFEHNGEIFFNAHDGETYQVWRTSGGEIETVTDFVDNATSAFTSNFFEFDDRIFFRGSGDEGLELWSLEVIEPLVPPPVLLDGDTDGNGRVEFADFLVISRNFGQDVSSRAEGDLDGNGRVEFADFLLLSQNFGNQIEEIFAIEQDWF